MKKYLAAVALLASVSMPATAAVLVADTGWQDDTLTAAGQPTVQSPWTFTVTQTSILSIVDCCVSGDTYTLSGDFAAATTFFAGNASDVQAEGSYGSFWLDAAYSKLALTVGPGSYTFSITGDGVGGVPAGLGVRLDTAMAAIPEPATWAMMIIGFGAVGTAMRRRRAAIA